MAKSYNSQQTQILVELGCRHNRVTYYVIIPATFRNNKLN